MNCVDKFAKVNQRMMKTYVECQGRLNDSRMEEYEENIKNQEEQARIQQLQLQESQQQESPSHPVDAVAN